ncbi:MAG: hypothetical protein N2Z84_01870 [Atribacterota bacterium]|nr:hypothetical protein [Atribacterota bacterium]
MNTLERCFQREILAENEETIVQELWQDVVEDIASGGKKAVRLP